MSRFRTIMIACIWITAAAALSVVALVLFNGYILNLWTVWNVFFYSYSFLIAPVAIGVTLVASIITFKAAKKNHSQKKIAVCDVSLLAVNVVLMILTLTVIGLWRW